MKIEIEATMPLRDPEAREARLLALGARRGPVLHETNSFFDTTDAVLKASDQGLRLRVRESPDGAPQAVTITHKGPRAHGKLKSRQETELNVDDARSAADLLSVLGYGPVFTFEKRRRCWEFSQCHIAIDTLPLLGHFVEIEGPSDDVVLAVREQLGLAGVPLIQASYIAMLTTHLAQNHITTDRVRFDDEDE